MNKNTCLVNEGILCLHDNVNRFTDVRETVCFMEDTVNCQTIYVHLTPIGEEKRDKIRKPHSSESVRLNKEVPLNSCLDLEGFKIH